MKTALFLFAPITFVLVSSMKPKQPVTTLKQMSKLLKDEFAYIPGGSFSLDKETYLVQGFFMLKTEVSNADYRFYLNALKSAGKTDAYQAALPDTSAWKMSVGFFDKYVDYYFNHPAYKDYPVVNISREQAENFCAWLTLVWRERTGNPDITFRLPYRAEFLRAAWGESSGRTYAWNSPLLMNEKGQPQCNFLNVGATAVTRDSVTGQLKLISPEEDEFYSEMPGTSDLIAPVKSYWPSDLGIYNLNGNAAEMVQEANMAVGGNWNSPGYDVRNESTQNFAKANPMVGFRPVMTFVEKK